MIFPEYTKGELIADACIHVVGVSASIVAACVLLVLAFTYLAPHAAPAPRSIRSASSRCSAARPPITSSRRPRLKSLLRRFDHAAIYIKIAATYTPFAVVKMGGAAGIGLLAASG